MVGKEGKEAKLSLSPELEDQVDSLHSQALLARACLLSFPPPGRRDRQWPDDSLTQELPDLAQPSPLLYYRLITIFSRVGGRGLGFLPQALLWAALPEGRQPAGDQDHSLLLPEASHLLSPSPGGMVPSFVRPLLGEFGSCLQLSTPTKANT